MELFIFLVFLDPENPLFGVISLHGATSPLKTFRKMDPIALWIQMNFYSKPNGPANHMGSNISTASLQLVLHSYCPILLEVD
jgi:hypothetical protein